MKEDEIQQMHVIVKGRVQGVGFRYTTRHLASQLGLKGSVRNLPDGDVEIFVQGRKDQLDNLIQHIKEAFDSGHIDDMVIEYSTPSKVWDTFKIV